MIFKVILPLVSLDALNIENCSVLIYGVLGCNGAARNKRQ